MSLTVRYKALYACNHRAMMQQIVFDDYNEQQWDRQTMVLTDLTSTTLP